MNFTIRQTQSQHSPPIPVGAFQLSVRDHIIIDAFSSNGATSTTEASPLPHMNHETTQDTLSQLYEIASQISLYDMPSPTELLTHGIEKIWGLSSLYPSVAFGLEAAILGLHASAQNKPLSHLLCQHPVSTIRCNALISPHISKTPFADLKKAQDSGITCFKFKIGHQDPIFDIEFIQEVATYLNDNDTLRLDPNGSWDIETWAEAAKEWKGIPIEYVEDPMPAPDDIHHFFDMTGLNIAADRWTLLHPLEDLMYIPGLIALVIKPTAFGSISKLQRYKQALKSTHVSLIISHCFEANEGKAILVELAKAYSGHNAVGIQ